jgi:hypothetical protein
MPRCGCGIFFKLKNPIFLMTLVGFVVDWIGIWWLYKLPITSKDEG